MSSFNEKARSAPYRDDKGLLLFPTGAFLGVYYTEELKYAQSIGYTVRPLRGYLYEAIFYLKGLLLIYIVSVERQRRMVMPVCPMFIKFL